MGISEPAVRKMISAGRLPNRAAYGPALVASADVDRVMHERREDAQRRHPDAAAFARRVRTYLWPEAVTGREVVLADGRVERAAASGYYPTAGRALPPTGRDALATLTPDASALFGRAAVEVAATPANAFAGGACRWCFADMSARVHGGLRPVDAPAYRVLLGDPCPADRSRWATEAEDRRRAAVRAQSADRARRTEAERTAARADFRAAQAAASVAASRLRSAARRVAAVDPTVARETAVRALTASGDMGCGCTRDRYVCREHVAMFGTTDRRAARS